MTDLADAGAAVGDAKDKVQRLLIEAYSILRTVDTAEARKVVSEVESAIDELTAESMWARQMIDEIRET